MLSCFETSARKATVATGLAETEAETRLRRALRRPDDEGDDVACLAGGDAGRVDAALHALRRRKREIGLPAAVVDVVVVEVDGAVFGRPVAPAHLLAGPV